MKPLFLSTLALAFALTSYADLTISQEIVQDGPGGNKTINSKMRVKGDKVRMDSVPQMSNILDLKTGEITSLMHPQKMVVKLPADTMKKMQEAQAAQAPKIEQPKATGKKETINGVACEEYETTLNGAKIQMWLTKDLPAVEKAMKDITRLAGASDPLQTVLKEQNITGYPMRTIMEMPGIGKMTMTVTALSEDPIADSEFQVPADYKPVAMPAGN